MKIRNLQTGQDFKGEIYESCDGEENLATGIMRPIYGWVIHILLNTGFEVVISKDEIYRIHPHTHSAPTKMEMDGCEEQGG